MIKQPTQPLRFFSSLLEVEREWEYRDKGTPGTHIITEDILFIPPFQIKFDDRHEDVHDFTIELTDYTNGTITDITEHFRALGVHTYGDYQNLVAYRFPLSELNIAGEYYLKIYDGVEIWYSEVFKLCDLSRNLLRSWTFSGWDWDTDVDVLAVGDYYVFQVCKMSAGDPSVTSGSFNVVKDEPLDLYLKGINAGICAAHTNFLHLNFVLHSTAGVIISNVVVGIEGSMSGRLIPTQTGEAHLHCYTDNADEGRSGWYVYLFHANPMTDNDADNIGYRKVLRWSNTCSICDMIYGIQDGYVKVVDTNYYWTMSYKNYLILDDPPLILDFAIIETVSEDDVSNKYLLLGAQQEWYYLQLATNESLAKAIQLIHLMNTVEIDYDGESHTICENITEISYADDYNFTTKLRFRETSCPVQSCCFEVCCPNVMNADNYENGGVGALIACNGGREHLRMIVLDGGFNLLYECDGANWVHMAGEEVDYNCIYLTQYNTGIQYWFWLTDHWDEFITIDSIADHAPGGLGIATITIYGGGMPGLYMQTQYSTDAGLTWTDCGTPVLSTGGADTIDCDCGAGVDIVFRLHVYSAERVTSTVVKCDYGYTNEHTETIT